jgi:hypothetical protein
MKREEWLNTKFGTLHLDPNQLLPNDWGPGSHSEFVFICSCGRTTTKQFYAVIKLKSCGHCEDKPKSYWLEQKWGELRLDPDQPLLDEWSQGSAMKVQFICDCGRTSIKAFRTAVRGNVHRCGRCNFTDRLILNEKWGKLRLDPDRLPEGEFSLKTGEKFRFLCDCGNSKEIVGKDVLREFTLSCGCVVAGTADTSPAHKIFELIVKSFPDALFSDKTIIKPYELDIWIPSIRTGIEYQGLRWHSEAVANEPKRDHDKHLLCESFGIRLLQIFGDENWQLIIDQLIPKSQKRIKPTYEFCHMNDVKEFLSKFHYLGDNQCSGTHYICAKYKSKVVGAWVFKKRPGAELEWTRASFDHQYKTWNPHQKALNLIFQLNQYQKIISFSDNRLHTGKLYQDLGFECVKELGPDYYYTRQQVRKHKFNFRVPAGVNEQEEAAKKGWYRIWDSGKKKWVLNVTLDPKD